MSWRTTRAAARLQQPGRQVAVIDLGSNSWRLVVFTFVPGSGGSGPTSCTRPCGSAPGWEPPGASATRRSRAGWRRSRCSRASAPSAGLAPTDVHAVATSAIRDASNGEQFVRTRPARPPGFRSRSCPAEEEARLGYVAAINTSTLTDGAVLEIGGGSMQLVEVADRRATALRVAPARRGAPDRGVPAGLGPGAQEGPRARPRPRARRARRRRLARRAGDRLVGIGGAVRNLAAAAQQRRHASDRHRRPGLRDHARDAGRADPGRWPRCRSPSAATVPGIKPGRGDIILAAALVIETVLEVGGFDGIEATEAGLRDGVFFDRELLAGQRRAAVRRRPRRRRCATSRSSTSPTSTTSSTSRCCRSRCSTRSSTAACSSPQPGERELLWAASMLHDVGMTISYDDHHKHSRYLIVSAELPGFDPRERALIAQISRYHRKGAPKLGEMAPLARPGDEELVARCSVILRLAEHLERGRDQSVRRSGCAPTATASTCTSRPPATPDPAPLERRALRRRRGVRARVRPAAADRLSAPSLRQATHARDRRNRLRFRAAAHSWPRADAD